MRFLQKLRFLQIITFRLYKIFTIRPIYDNGYFCLNKWGERNTAVTTYFGENEFFTKMNTIFNVTDSDKFLKLLYK